MRAGEILTLSCASTWEVDSMVDLAKIIAAFGLAFLVIYGLNRLIERLSG